jgi:hypothetical protein
MWMLCEHVCHKTMYKLNKIVVTSHVLLSNKMIPDSEHKKSLKIMRSRKSKKDSIKYKV